MPRTWRLRPVAASSAEEALVKLAEAAEADAAEGADDEEDLDLDSAEDEDGELRDDSEAEASAEAPEEDNSLFIGAIYRRVGLMTIAEKIFAAETRKSVKEHFDRRMKLAEEKIARAEADAVREVRSVAVDAAIAAAQTLIAEKLTPDRAEKLVSEGIDTLKSKLN